MYFTKHGYHEKSKVVSAKMSLNSSGSAEYQRILVPKATIRQLGPSEYKDRQPVPSLQDVMSLLYNIAQGQRVTTPPYLDQFIDRYGKTFFREEAHLRFILCQDAVTNLTAISNYYHLTRNDPSVGCIEALADEYLFCCGTLGKMLWDAVNRDAEPEPEDTELVIDKKKSFIFHVELPEDAREMLSGELSSESDAIMFAEGALACGSWKDHSTTNKDLDNNRIREAIDDYKPFIESAPVFDRELFACPETVAAFIEMARCPKHEWLIDAEGKRLYDRIGDGEGRELDAGAKKGRRS